MCSCPCHDDREPSLSVRDGDDGELWVTCFADCPRRKIYAELRRRGLLPGRPFPCVQPTFMRAAAPRALQPDPERVLKRWRNAQRAQGTIVDALYLPRRGILLRVPPTLRCGVRFHHGRFVGPTMVAAVQNPAGQVVAVHETLLTDRAERDRGPWARLIFGSLGNSAVRLAKAGDVLGLAEGIETALSRWDRSAWTRSRSPTTSARSCCLLTMTMPAGPLSNASSPSKKKQEAGVCETSASEVKDWNDVLRQAARNQGVKQRD
jgi:putative DNA primase/helicase